MIIDKRLTYDISDCIKAIRNNPSNSNLRELQKVLNKLFKDCNCKQVLYSNNTDHLFFGMRVMPYLTGELVNNILMDDETIRIKSYYLELDSRLFDPLLGLTNAEITAILLHEIGHLTNNGKPVDEVRRSIDGYLAAYGEVLRYSPSIKYSEILSYGIADALVKVTSVFYAKDKEYQADEFVVACGYGHELESALNKIVKNGSIANREVNDKFIVLSWTLRVYKDVKNTRIRALATINRCMDLTASQLEKQELRNLSDNLKKISDNILIKESVLTEGKFTDKIRKMKLDGISKFDSDFYELNMLKNNVGDQDEALLIMRQINTRISILDDAIRTEKLSDYDLKKYSELLEKYMELRDTLSKKLVYKDRFVGVMVNYPETKGIDY